MTYTHGYTCPYCGQHHVSDDTELWCMVARKEKPPMFGYRLRNLHAGPIGYSVSRPPSGGEPCELPEHVAACFERRETGTVKTARGTQTNCPLHVVFCDEQDNIVDKSYRYA